MAQPNHIILAVADSLRQDTVLEGGVGLPYTEANGINFTNARSTGPWTLPATASMFTGRTPHEHGATSQSREIRADIPTLAEQMKAQGYYTYQLTANIATTGIFGLHRGFDQVRPIFKEVPAYFGQIQKLLLLFGKPRIRRHLFSKDYLQSRLTEDLEAAKTWMQNTHQAVIEESRKLIDYHEQRGESVFLFMNMMETHFPYHAGPTFRMSNEGLLKRFRELLALYHQVNQTFLMKGHQVIEPDMLATLKARQRLAWEIIREPLDAFLREQHEGKNNLVVFCSDHGDNFGDQDWTYHFANVTDGGNRVPLYWLPPGESRPRTESTNVGARYLYHELLRAAGGNADGPSLLQEPEQCLPLIESYWYNKRGKTLPKYHYNQFCFLNDSTRYVLRNDRWLHAPVGPTGPAEPVFEPLDPNIDPIQEVADAEQRQYLQSRMREFSEFSRKVLP